MFLCIFLLDVKCSEVSVTVTAFAFIENSKEKMFFFSATILYISRSGLDSKLTALIGLTHSFYLTHIKSKVFKIFLYLAMVSIFQFKMFLLI